MKIHNSCGLCKIKLEHLSVISEGDVLLEDVNLEFHCGQLTALIGRNGAGKSTLLKAILGQKAYQGNIQFENHLGGKAERPKIGYVPQQLEFDKNMPVTVNDFFTAAATNSKGFRLPIWLKSPDPAPCKEALEKMDCDDLAGKRLGDLSGGELQRVLLALATTPVPDLLILDEPVSGVDATGLDLFYRRVADLLKHYHMAILLVSHDLSLIRRYADKVVLLDKKVVAEGTPLEVFSSTPFQESFGYLFQGGEEE